MCAWGDISRQHRPLYCFGAVGTPVSLLTARGAPFGWRCNAVIFGVGSSVGSRG